jgi:hypothetical protein
MKALFKLTLCKQFLKKGLSIKQVYPSLCQIYIKSYHSDKNYIKSVFHWIIYMNNTKHAYIKEYFNISYCISYKALPEKGIFVTLKY